MWKCSGAQFTQHSPVIPHRCRWCNHSLVCRLAPPCSWWERQWAFCRLPLCLFLFCFMTIRNAILVRDEWKQTDCYLAPRFSPHQATSSRLSFLSPCMHRVFHWAKRTHGGFIVLWQITVFLIVIISGFISRLGGVSFCMLFYLSCVSAEKAYKKGHLQWGPWKWNLFRPAHVVSVAKLIIYTLSGQRYSFVAIWLLFPLPWSEYLWTPFLVQLA